jgi:hypothetical protein
MRCRPAALVILLAVGACASPPSSPSAVSPSVTPEPPALDCGSVADDVCRSVADAAQLMTGTASLSVAALPLPTDGGLPMEERYVVTLQAANDDAEAQLVEVVRFEGNDNWSARRLDRMPAD